MSLEIAMLAAFEWHRGQVDKAGLPYILHPLRVMEAMPAGDRPARIAAILHDVLEDCGKTRADLAEISVPLECLDALDALTRQPSEPYPEYISRVAMNDLARQVKIADIRDNLWRLPDVPGEDTRGRLRRKYEAALKVLAPPPPIPSQTDPLGEK